MASARKGIISIHFVVGLMNVVIVCMIQSSFATTWKVRPQNTSVHLGRNVTLYCEFDDLGAGHSVIWQKGVDVLFINHDRQVAADRYFITGSMARGQFNLLVTGAVRADDFTYRCSVGKASLKQDAHLTIIAPPEKPTVTLPTGTDGLQAGNEVKLLCKSNGGNPAPTVKWSRNGQPISGSSIVTTPAKSAFGETSSELTWRLSAADNNVPFTCTVENAANEGNPIENSIRLPVQYGPIVSLNPQGTVKVVENTKLTIKCQVDANPAVTTVTWFKGGQKQTETGMEYSIDSVSYSEHRGTYECVAANKISEGRGQATVDVLYPPKVSVPDVPSGEIVVSELSKVHLKCVVDANPKESTVHWRKIGSENKIFSPDLHLIDIERSQAGAYVCEASNTIHPTNGNPSTANGNATVNVVVTYAPGKAEVEQVTAKAVIGHDVTLRCTVQDKGVPLSKYIWSKEGDTTFSSEGMELTLRSISWNASGVYACTARNEVGTGPSGRRVLKVYEGVSFLPPYLETIKYVKVSDRQLSVMCEVRGEPAPTVTWYKNGAALLPGSASLFTVTVTQQGLDGHSHRVTSQLQWLGDGRLPSRDSLSYEDAGNYSCVTSNGVLEAKTRTVKLVVQYPPIIQVPERKVASDLGESVTLSCDCRSLPTPVMSWYLGNRKLINNDRIKINTGKEGETIYRSTLSISKIVQGDLELYTCVAGNHLGNSSASIQLMKRGRPESPYNPEIKSITWESCLLKWTAGFDGGYPQFFVILYKSETGPEQRILVSSANATTHNISGLLPSTKYSFAVSGENKLGRSKPSSVVSVRTQEFNIPPPRDVVYSAKDQVLRFRSDAANTCARISLSADGKLWSLYEPCAPSAGGSIKITTQNKFSQVNVSLCLERRQDVCSPSVLAKFVAAESGMSLTVIIAIVCSVVGVLVVMVIVVLVIHCNRRKNLSADKNQDVPDSRLYHQNVLNTEHNRPAHENTANNKPNNTYLAEKSVMLAADNQSYAKPPSGPYSEPYRHNQQSWTSQPMEHNNFYNNQYHPSSSSSYNPAGSRPYSPPNYLHINNPQYGYGQNLPNADVFNNSGDSLPSRGSSEQTGSGNPYKPDTHSQSSVESGYSTPTKSKKVIREIVV